ncbi:MAG: DUF190 domain-containing protein [Acidiferrobacter sp.]
MKDVVIVRIYIREGDKFEGHSLMQEIFSLLHDQHKVHGVTVFRGIAGFGTHGEVHSADLLRMTVHLPLVIEFYDEVDSVAAVMPRLKAMVPPGHIVNWQAQCHCE